jgi:hypothetical protein
MGAWIDFALDALVAVMALGTSDVGMSMDVLVDSDAPPAAEATLGRLRPAVLDK